MQKAITYIVGMIYTNCYIVYDDDTLEGIVIDPGEDAAGIWDIIQREKLKLKYIFLTHGHFDHIMGLPKLRELSGAPVVVHKEDASSIAARKNPMAPAEHQPVGGETFAVGGLTFQWIHTPGHTRGSSCILCGNVLYSGDTLFQTECGSCDMEGGSFEAMLSSLKHLAQLPGDYVICPGHGPSSTMEAERKQNPYILQAVS